MSRIIVKNMPRSITEDYVREMFGAKGTITDLHFKYCPKTGHFRRFGFIGYKTDDEAKAAMKFFDGTFLRTCRIKVEICSDLGDPNKPRAWSKYSKDSSAYQKSHPKALVKKAKKKSDDGQTGISSVLDKFKDDPKFSEFVEVHKTRTNKVLWNNDDDFTVKTNGSQLVKENKEKTGKDDSSDAEEGHGSDTNEERSPKKAVSDLDYLRSKMGKGENGKSAGEDVDERDAKQLEKRKKLTEFTVKMRGVTSKCNKAILKEFFKPLTISRVKQPPKLRDVAYVKFSSERDVKQALTKHRGFLDGRRVFLTRYQIKETEVLEDDGGQHVHWKKLTADLTKNSESIAESGELFVRNLSYTVTEEDLENLFKQYGPLVEIRIPIQSWDRRPKGFAFVVFLIPEHAVKAFSELDGTSFQGRLLHILPGKNKPKDEEDTDEGSSFKKKQAVEQKAQSGSSHNWNALFLGANAVADVVAEKYNTTKQDLLNPESSESVAVRMALGETQIVVETRKFLLVNGVELDAFSQPATKRSKMVMLVKNLPADTSAEELRTTFGKYGEVGRIVFPPSGITAVVEFLHPTEARRAFNNLAYTKFHDTPLYLEWAPVKVFTDKPLAAIAKNKHADDGKSEVTGAENDRDVDGPEGNGPEDEEEDEEEPPEADTTLFVKNLNFDTTEESLRKPFEKCGKLHSVTVARKKDLQNPGGLLSLGYGFVQFQKKSDMQKALKQLQHTTVDGHKVELKVSNRTLSGAKIPKKSKSSVKVTVQKSTKVLVRNIPFEATKQEVEKLFRTFGEIKTVRLPKKMTGTGTHRGFGFVDYVSRHDAKRAFEALCHSTHLYGRRLVLEWADDDDQNVESLRKRTVEHYHQGVPAPKKLRKAAILEQLEAPEAD